MGFLLTLAFLSFAMVVYGEMRTGILNGGCGTLSCGIQLRGAGLQISECRSPWDYLKPVGPSNDAVSTASNDGPHGFSRNSGDRNGLTRGVHLKPIGAVVV